MSRRKPAKRATPGRPRATKEKRLLGQRPISRVAAGQAGIARRMRGLLRLFEARLEAIAAGREVWDFALEFDRLCAAAGLTEPDVRWLVAERLIEFAVETTANGARERSFRHGGRLSLTASTAFVLSGRAAALMASYCDNLFCGARLLPEAPSVARVEKSDVLPVWYAAAGELWFAGALVRVVPEDAGVVRELLDFAQGEGWPKYIDNPFDESESPPVRAKRLSHKLDRLNQKQIDARLHFGVRNKGRQFTWRALGCPPLSLGTRRGQVDRENRSTCAVAMLA